MSKFLIRNDYYQMILEIIELERISVGDYLENKYTEFKESNPHFIEILYKDINKVLDGVLKDDDGDLALNEMGDFVEENGDFKFTGPINNLHLVELGLHQLLVEKTVTNVKDPNEFIRRMEKFENEYLEIDYNTPEYNIKLKELNERIKGWQEKKVQVVRKTKRRVPIPKEKKLRAELQKEINSVCPFCDNGDVGHFEIHHIDEDPSNNEITNLILLCPTCHSKITKGDISNGRVVSVKENSTVKSIGVEFVSATVDNENCSWACTNTPNTFFNSDIDKSPFPVISFTLINHTRRTLVLKTIRLKVKKLPSGIHGIPKAHILKSLTKYKFGIDDSIDENIYQLLEPLQLPANQAMKFDIELYEKISITEVAAPNGRNILFFTFDFSNEIKILIPKIFLNCTDENESFEIHRS